MPDITMRQMDDLGFGAMSETDFKAAKDEWNRIEKFKPATKRYVEMKFSFKFRLFDFWVGFYYNRTFNILYVCPLPMCCFRFEFSGRKK